MLVHGVVAGVGGVAGLFAGIHERHEVRHRGFRNAAGGKGGRYVLLVLVGHVHGELVSHEAYQGAVQLLIKRRVEVLVQEILGLGQPFERLAGGLAVARAGHIGPSLRHLAEAQPEAQAGKEDEADTREPALGIHQEALVRAQRGLGADKADVLSQVLDALAVHHQGVARVGLAAALRRGGAGHGQGKGRRGERLVLALVHVVVAVVHGAYLEGARAARNKGIFEGLGAGGATLVRVHAGLDVIDLEIRREVELGRFQQGHVALSGHRDNEGGRIVRLQGILAQVGRYLEVSHAASEGSRGPGRQGFHMHLGRLGGHPLADGHVVAAEEIVKDGAGGAALLDVHQAHHLGGFDALVSGLLGNEHPAAEHRGIVHGAVHLLALEFDVGGRFHFLAPEAAEGRKAGVFKALQIGPVINLEGGRDGLSHHHGVAAQAQAHENIGIGRALLPGL